ncbi:hypothetical protein GCM10023228_00660 [Brevibacillus fulvus]
MIAALFLKQRSPKAEASGTLDQKEIERTLQRFVSQIKQENEKVRAELRQTKDEMASELAALRQELEQAEARYQALTVQVRSLGERKQATEEEETRAEDQSDILALRERYRRVFELKGQGLSLDEIAKTLGAGRGEIELIVSLASPAERGAEHE